MCLFMLPQIQLCLKYGHYQYLPHCLEIQAECAHFMGDDKKSADLYRKCYYLCQVIEYQEGLEITKKEAKEYLGMTMASALTSCVVKYPP